MLRLQPATVLSVVSVLATTVSVVPTATTVVINITVLNSFLVTFVLMLYDKRQNVLGWSGGRILNSGTTSSWQILSQPC